MNEPYPSKCKGHVTVSEREECPTCTPRSFTSNENSLPADGRTEEAAIAELISIVRALRRDRDHFQACWNSVSEMRATNDRLCQENERLRAALERYGRHEHPNCHDLTLKEDSSFGPRNGCLCGLDSVLSGTSVVETGAGQLRASEWAAANNAAVTDEWMRGWDACLVASRIPLATGSLLRPVSTQAPPGCYCTDRCAAPVVMGRQTPCRDPEKAARFAQETSEPQNDKCQHDLQVPGNSIVLTDNNTRAVCVYCAQEWLNPALPQKASAPLCKCGRRSPHRFVEGECGEVKAPAECKGCKEGWHRQGAWHWDKIGHMHECTAPNGKGDV